MRWGVPGCTQPRPPLHPTSKRFTQFTVTQHSWETDAVNFRRDAIRDAEPSRIWAPFDFFSRDGTAGEVDSLVLTTKGA